MSATDVIARLIEALSKMPDAELEEKSVQAWECVAFSLKEKIKRAWDRLPYVEACERVGRAHEERLLKAIDRDPELAFRIPREFTGGMTLREAMSGSGSIPEAASDIWPAVRERYKHKLAERQARLAAAKHRIAASHALYRTALWDGYDAHWEKCAAQDEHYAASKPRASAVTPLYGIAELFGRRAHAEQDSEPWPPSRQERIEALADLLWLCDAIGVEVPPIAEW